MDGFTIGGFAIGFAILGLFNPLFFVPCVVLFILSLVVN